MLAGVLEDADQASSDNINAAGATITTCQQAQCFCSSACGSSDSMPFYICCTSFLQTIFNCQCLFLLCDFLHPSPCVYTSHIRCHPANRMCCLIEPRAFHMLPNAQVISLCAAPFLLDHPEAAKIFAPDAIARAKELHKAFNGGAQHLHLTYTQSKVLRSSSASSACSSDTGSATNI